MTKLHDLYKEYDEEWAKLVAIPIEDRQKYSRAYAEEHPGVNHWEVDLPEAEAIKNRLRELTKAVEEEGERDFFAEYSDALRDKVRADETFAHWAYSALCNVDWEHDDGSRGSGTWRYAGGAVADMVGKGEDYMDYYCGGDEGMVAEKIEDIMANLGWHHDG